MDFNIHIQGLGKIEDLTLEIKPLTVIAGENSSGKTFATKSIYCVLEALNQNQLLGAFKDQEADFMRLVYHYEASLMPKIAKVDEEFLGQLKESFIITANEIECCLSEISLLEHFKLEKMLENSKIQLATLKSNIKEYLKKRTKIDKIKKSSDILNKANDVLLKIIKTLSDNKETVTSYIANKLSDNFKANYQVTRLSELVNSNDINEAKIKIEKIGELLFTQKDTISFNFDVQGVHEIQKLEHVVFIDSPVYLRIRQGLQRSRFGFLRSRAHDRELKGYPEYIDNLYNYTDRKYMDEPKEVFLQLSKLIQNTISGKLIVNKAGEIHYHDEKGQPTPLSLAATGVSNLGLIDLLIRNSVIQKGSFLIIDEPEAHIHPKWQVLLMEILYKMAQAGVNVIIATHSLDMLKKLQLIVKDESEAKNIVSMHRMPESHLNKNASLLDKIEESLSDLSTPYYEMYIEENE